MGFFSDLFGSDKKNEINEEIDISEAAAAHVSWKLRLQKYLDGTSVEKLEADIVCRDDLCKLGMWIHGPAQRHFAGVEAFGVLLVDHAMFHQLAGDIVRHVHADDIASAHALMEGEYKHVSHKVVMALTELNNELVS